MFTSLCGAGLPLSGSFLSSPVTQTVITHHSKLQRGQGSCFMYSPEYYDEPKTPWPSLDWTCSYQRSVHTTGTPHSTFFLKNRLCQKNVDLTVWLLPEDHLLCRKLPQLRMKFRVSHNGLHHIICLTVAATKESEKSALMLVCHRKAIVELLFQAALIAKRCSVFLRRTPWCSDALIHSNSQRSLIILFGL